MKHYILENDMDIEIFTDKKEAVEKANYLWNHMTESEKQKAQYFQVYEIECEDIDTVEDDLMDLMTEMVINFKEA